MMRLNSLKSIRARMTVAFALAIGLLMLLVCGGLIIYARHAAERRSHAALEAAAARVRAEMAEKNDAGGPRHGVSEAITENSEAWRADDLAVLVVDARGRAVTRSGGVVPPWPPQRGGEGDDWRVVAVPFGADTVVIGQPWKKTEDALRNQALMLLFLNLVVTLFAVVGAWVIVGRTLSPIGLLSRQARSASPDTLPIRLSAPSRDAEVVELVATLNDLLARLSQTTAAKGRFYAAASHELRTPLQALSGHLEVALGRPRTGGEYRAAIEEAYAQTRRLASLVRDVLLLNQLDSAPCPPPPKEPVDIAEICERVLFQLRPAVSERNLTVSTDLPDEGAMVPGPPTHAEMLARNLIENAVKYAEPGGAICVRVITASSGETKMEAFNPFPPLPRLNTEQLFEPFFRPDASRNAATGGNGLGLAICRAIAAANGWGLRLTQEDDGVRASVSFSPPRGRAA